MISNAIGGTCGCILFIVFFVIILLAIALAVGA